MTTGIRRAPTAEEIDIAKAWVVERHGECPNSYPHDDPAGQAEAHLWAQDASDAYAMVLAVLAFAAEWKAQTAPAVLLDRYNWRWYYQPETGEYREKLTGQHGTRELLEERRAPLLAVEDPAAVSR